MHNTNKPGQIGGSSKLRRLRLLLFLAGLQPLLSAGEKPELYSHSHKLQVFLLGPDYVTVSVPASVVCFGTCSKCTYQMSLEGGDAKGRENVLDFRLDRWAENVTATCTATDDITAANATATKRFQVLVGPANVSITGPDVTNASNSYTYTCHAHCRPSCTYAWRTDNGAWIGGYGNVVSVTPKKTTDHVALTCKATNNVSGMFVSATEKVTVARLNSGPSTRPEGTPAVLLLLLLLLAAFVASAAPVF
ncbi:uncharacterized protein LOC114861858 [Betta splendens]|uniref:Uncharacterized protein LOC114861858 n=1 Tax=Betta splendens TaxID=158456 RepID=A0A6P7NCJ6_BETSP|nr:uncharacterized protein LOC114861858 [Betta splendens]